METLAQKLDRMEDIRIIIPSLPDVSQEFEDLFDVLDTIARWTRDAQPEGVTEIEELAKEVLTKYGRPIP